MSNWSGTYTIAAGATGTLTAATSTTATNSGANWPIGAQGLTNFYIRLLTGPGSGVTVPITANTATQVTVASWPNGTPTSSTTYEIILILNDQDHITGAFAISTNVITEIQDSATILVDGLYIVNLSSSSVVRWNKSESTLATFAANNRTVQGKNGFWNYVTIDSTKISPTPNLSYLRFMDAGYLPLIVPTTAVGNASTLHHWWGEDLAQGLYATSISLVTNMTVANMLMRSSAVGNINPVATYSNFSQTFDYIWTERCQGGGLSWSGVNAPTLLWIRNSVFKNASIGHNVDNGAGKEFRVSKTYLTNGTGSSSIMLGSGSASAAGLYTFFHNVTHAGRAVYGVNATSTATLKSDSNDVAADNASINLAFEINSPTAYTSATSNFDYLAGNNGAAIENVDMSTTATSTANPQQYKNLTARTNPQSVVNFPYTINNVQIGTPTYNSVVVTFDCANGAQSGQSTSVNIDSTSGQATLSTASTPFLVGMLVEIGYGTARSEIGRIASINPGVSITLENNLSFTHTAAQADAVQPQLRHIALPFIDWGMTSNNYNMSTSRPSIDDWGLFYTGIKTLYNGQTYTWKRTGHSVTLSNLQPNTTYYFRPYGYTPLGNIVDNSAEFSFTTAIAPGAGQKSYTFVS
jgi:hypothetical protein